MSCAGLFHCCRRLAGVAIVLGGFLAAAPVRAIPYNPDEVAALRAFLVCASLVDGKTNAEVLGVNPADPSTWTGVGWVDHDPQVPINDPPVPLASFHVASISFTGELGGSITVSGFSYLEQFRLSGLEGAGCELSDVTIRGNPRLGAGLRLRRSREGKLRLWRRLLLSAGPGHSTNLKESLWKTNKPIGAAPSGAA